MRTAPNDRWQDAVTRRVRALARTEPLHAAERSKARRDLDLEVVDLRSLALRAIDVVIEEMGLGRGAERAYVRDALAGMVIAAAPALARDAEEVANLVIDALLNDADRRQAFEAVYTDWTAEPVARELRWHLLEERELADGSFVLCATTEGINVYTGMLEVDVQDAQVAEEAVLHAQIRRGRVQDAVRTAQNARLRSIEYAEQIRRLLSVVERDIVQVSWRSELGHLLTDAREHLTDRLETERVLVSLVDDRLDEASEDDAPHLASLIDVIRECQNRHIGLHKRVLGAGDVFLVEQERQYFRQRVLLSVPDLEAEVLLPALGAPAGALGDALERLLRALVPAAARPHMTVGQLADRLLAPATERATAAVEIAPVELERVDTAAAWYDGDDIALVDQVLDGLGDGGARLSTMLDDLRAAGGSERAMRRLVLSAMLPYQPGLEMGRAIDDGTKLVDTTFFGADLLVVPVDR